MLPCRRQWRCFSHAVCSADASGIQTLRACRLVDGHKELRNHGDDAFQRNFPMPRMCIPSTCSWHGGKHVNKHHSVLEVVGCSIDIVSYLFVTFTAEGWRADIDNQTAGLSFLECRIHVECAVQKAACLVLVGVVQPQTLMQSNESHCSILVITMYPLTRSYIFGILVITKYRLT